MTSNNIKVCIKIRPLILREKNENLPSVWSLVDENTIKSQNKEYKLSFDHIFDETRTTEELFNIVAKPIVINAVKGINGTIFAYGQTSSGKTYSMMGTEEEPGIIPLTINEIFKQVEQAKDREFLIRVGYIEIYNEKIFDLLVENKPEINKIHETNGEVSVNQTEILSSTPQNIIDCYNEGNKGRRIGETSMNERSSRSHTIFRIVIESHENGNDGVFQVSTLNLVDLAGSERADQTKATGERLREGGHINKSLLSLSKVIRELSDLTDDKTKNVDGTKYINYRDSKLTRILSASLGGNAMTAIICTVTPCALEETYSTLTFACNAKKIKNQPKVNETVSDKVIMARLQKEIADLKDKLNEEKSKKSEFSKIERLIAQIFDRENQIIHFHSEPLSKTMNTNRRRTWCPLSHMEKIVEEGQPIPKNALLAPPPPFILKQQESVSANVVDDFSPINDFMANEVFYSPDKVKFDDNIMMMSPRRGNYKTPDQFRTPKSLRPTVEVDSPFIGKPGIEDENKILKSRIIYLQDELDEMQYFKVIEENAEIKVLQENLKSLQTQLAQTEHKVEMLETDMTEKMIEIETLKDLKDKCEAMEIECKQAVEDREKAENVLTSVQYEYDVAKTKFKNRETELINCLDEARKESDEAVSAYKEKIKNLEHILRKTEEELIALESQKTAQNIEKVPDTSKITQLENSLKDLEMKLQVAQKEREASAKLLAEKNTEIETLSEQIVDAVQDTDGLQSKITEMEQVIKENDREFEKLTSKILELEDISNRYQKIQQIVTVSETVSEMYYDMNDDVYKCVVQLQQSATRTETLETENKQLLSQISENNRINEEVENLHQKINELEEAIKCKDDDNVNLSTQHKQLTNRLENIQKLLLSNQTQTNDDEGDEIHQLIIRLKQESNKVEVLEAEKQQLLKTIEENCSVNQNLLEVRDKIAELEAKIKEKDLERQNLIDKHDEFSGQLKNIQEALENDELPSVDEQTGEICKLIIKLRKDAMESKQLDEKLIENKISDLEEVIKNKDSEKEDILNKFSEYEGIVNQFRKVEEIVKSMDEENIGDNFDVCAIITKLYENLINVKNLVAEKDELLSQMSANNSTNEDIKVLEQKSKELEEIIKSKEVEKESLMEKFLEHEKTTEQFQKIQEFLINNEPLPDDLFEENDEIIKVISSLRLHAEKANTLEVEIQKLLTETAEIKEQNSHKAIEFEKNIHNLRESIELKETENQELNSKLTEQKQALEKFEKIQHVLSNNESISEECFDDNFGKMICKLHQTASRSESLEYEKQQLLNEIAEIRHGAEVLSEKLLANQTISETEYQLREKIDILEGELKEVKDQLDQQIVKNNEYESLQLDLQIKIEEVLKDKEELASHIVKLNTSIESKSIELQKLQEQHEESSLKVHSYENEISQLTSKLDELKIQNINLTESSADCASKVSKLDAELTNSRSQLVIKEEEFKLLQKELDQNKEQLKEKFKECDDLKVRYRRRSEDNERKVQELEIAKSKLMQEVGATEALKVSIENDLKKLKEEYNRVLIENKALKEKNNDNDMKYAILDEKFSQLSSINLDLETKLKEKMMFESKHLDVQKKLEHEILELHQKMNEKNIENSEKGKVIEELYEKCEKLIKEVDEQKFKPKRSSSPAHRRSDEKELFSAQHRLNNLQGENNNIGTPARTVKTNIERKTRRQSAYDERRDLSAWELTQSESTQTDPVDRLCACVELAEKIKELQGEIRLRDCKIANAQRMANVNIYKYQLEDAIKECQREKQENSQLQETVEMLKGKIRVYHIKNQELELNQRCHDIHSRGIQTDKHHVIAMDEYEKVVTEKSLLEKKLIETSMQLRQNNTVSEKENLSANNLIQDFTSSESGISGSNQLGYENLHKEYKILEMKYEKAKRLCNLRSDDLNKLREEMQAKTILLEKLSEKYDSAKVLLDIRKNKIQVYRERLGEKGDLSNDMGDFVLSPIKKK